MARAPAGVLSGDAIETLPDRPTAAGAGAGQSTSTRLALRDIRRAVSRKRRRRRLQLLAVLTLLVVGGTAGYLNLPGREASSPAGGTASPSSGFQITTQRTVLFQVRGPAGDAVASALLAHDPGKHNAAVVVVPSRVAAPAETGDSTLFGQTLRGDNGPAQSRRALSDLLGVRIDDSWTLSQTAFSRLVTRVGGITLDVDVDILAQRAGTQKVVVSKGSDQQLDGARALSLINYRPAGKDELASLPRIHSVLQALFSKLPEGGSKVAELTGQLGNGSDLTDVLAVPRVVDGVRVEQDAGRATVSTVPVLAVGSGAGLTYRVEPQATTRLVTQVLAGSARIGKPEKGNRVLALDGVGRAGLGASIRNRITPAGFKLVDTRKETPGGRTQTIIFIFDTTSQSTIRASQLASALGLPKAPVQVAVRMQNIADLIVHVGSDFKP